MFPEKNLPDLDFLECVDAASARHLRLARPDIVDGFTDDFFDV